MKNPLLKQWEKDKMKPAFYNPHETERMKQIEGLPLASFKSRLFAIALDLMIVAVIFISLSVFGIPILQKIGWVSEEDIKLNFDIKNWYILVYIVLYFGIFNYLWNGQTLGKRIFRIRVVSIVHEHISLWHSIERALGYAASALEFGFGFFQYFIHPNKRTVHDRIAETIVVSEPGKKTGNSVSI